MSFSSIGYQWALKLCFVCVVVLSGYGSEALADNYFVAASNGNDGNRGTLEAPFKTLNRGISVLIPGDTLYVRSGTYVGTHNLAKIPNGNSWEQPVTLKAYANEKVIITAMPFRSSLYFNYGSHYIFVEGFIFDATGGVNGIQFLAGSHHIRIRNSEILNSNNNGILTGTSHHLELINLKIHNNGRFPGKGYGIYMNGDNILLQNCAIYDNGGYGVHMYSSEKSPSYNTIINNKIYNNGTIFKAPAIGIYKGKGNSVINNVIWGNWIGVEVNSGASDTKVFNNTIHANAHYGIWLGSTNSNSLISNNITSLNGSNGIIITKGSKNSRVSYNLVAATDPSKGLKNWESTTILSKNLGGSINDVKYVNYQSKDFHLLSGSSAIDSGTIINEVKDDFDGITRSQSIDYDIGAFSYNR